MATITAGFSNISLTSRRTGTKWSEGSYTAGLVFSEAVPTNATVKSAKLTATTTQNPLSGPYIWLNGTAVRTRGSTTIDVSVSPGASKLDVVCTFKGNGTDNVTSIVTFDLSLTVEYELNQMPSSFTLDKTTVKAGQTITATITPYRASYGHQLLCDYNGHQVATAILQPGTTAASLTIPTSWLSDIPYASSAACTVTLRCWEGSSTSFFGYTSKSVTFTLPDDAAPTVGTVSVAPLLTVDGTTYPSVIAGGYVQNKSGYSAAFGGATCKYGAVVSAYSISGGGYSGSGASYTSGLLRTAGKQTITFKVVDSRGLSATKTVDITVTAYSPPQVTALAAWRADAEGTADGMGTRGKWRAAWSFSELGGANALTSKAYIKAVNGTETELGRVAEGGITPTWSRKAILMSGANAGMETDSTNRIADLTYYSVSQYTWSITADAACKTMIFSYDANKQFLGFSGWSTTGQHTLSAGAAYFRVEASYADNRTITDDNVSTPSAVIKLVSTSADTWWIAGTDGTKLTLEIIKRYVLRVALTDAYGTVERTVEIPSAHFAMHMNAQGNGICIGGASTVENAVEIPAELNLAFKGTNYNAVFGRKNAWAADLNSDTEFGAVRAINTTKNTPDGGWGTCLNIISTGQKGDESNITTQFYINDNAGMTGVWIRKRNTLGAFTAWTPMAEYPIGAIYISTDSKSPAAIFGGTWVQIKDRFLLAAGDTYAAGKEGGAANHTHTTSGHTLTVEEIPEHAHYISEAPGNETGTAWVGAAGTAAQQQRWTNGVGKSGAHSHGNTGSASNMPPYLAVYIWKRTA